MFAEGDVIGQIGGLDGSVLGEVVAPISGIVHEMCATSAQSLDVCRSSMAWIFRLLIAVRVKLAGTRNE